MKLKQFIQQLQQVLKECGDIEVIMDEPVIEDTPINTCSVKAKPVIEADMRLNIKAVKIVSDE